MTIGILINAKIEGSLNQTRVGFLKMCVFLLRYGLKNKVCHYVKNFEQWAVVVAGDDVAVAVLVVVAEVGRYKAKDLSLT